MTLKSGLDKMRSNSLNTSGCGESRQIDSFGEIARLVATLVRVVKSARTGKWVQETCSRIDTDKLDDFHRRSERDKAIRLQGESRVKEGCPPSRNGGTYPWQ